MVCMKQVFRFNSFHINVFPLCLADRMEGGGELLYMCIMFFLKLAT